MNDEYKLDLNINEKINSNKKVSPRGNKFSTIKEVNSNINEDKNFSFKKTLSNGMDKSIKNRYNNIKNINGKENMRIGGWALSPISDPQLIINIEFFKFK